MPLSPTLEFDPTMQQLHSRLNTTYLCKERGKIQSSGVEVVILYSVVAD